ncbi:MAG: hypothetical protein ACOVOX_09260 [Burkholderiaceae bacterium]
MNPRMPTSDAVGDEAVDAHLRTALRHAPDADAAPPAALSAAILSQARAAASIKQTSTQAEPWAPVWQLLAWLRQGWIALSQPALAAGVASVMVASVVGVMWWDRVPEDVSAPRELGREQPAPARPSPDTLATKNEAQPMTEPPTRAAQTASVAVPGPKAGAIAEAVPPAVGPTPAAATKVEGPTSATLQAAEQRRMRADGALSKQGVTTPPPTRSEAAAPAASPVLSDTAPAAKQAEAPAPNDATADTAMRQRPALSTPPALALPKPSAPVSATPPAASPVAPPAPAPANAPSPPPAPAPLAATAAAAPQAMSQERALGRTTAHSSSSALGSALNPSTPSVDTALAKLRLALQLEPGLWTWQKNAALLRPIGPEVQQWLAELESATAGRWAATADLKRTDPVAALLTLRWTREGQTAHTMVLRPDGLLWQAAGSGAAAWFAPLDSATVTRLSDAVP